MIGVPDALSLAAMRRLEGIIGKKCGGSTGTNFYGALTLAREMRARGERGSIVTLLCDAGDRYLHTYYDAAWIQAQGIDLAAALAQVDALLS
jgi:cysteine synthase A